jgi:hypothetical protein
MRVIRMVSVAAVVLGLSAQAAQAAPFDSHAARVKAASQLGSFSQSPLVTQLHQNSAVTPPTEPLPGTTLAGQVASSPTVPHQSVLVDPQLRFNRGSGSIDLNWTAVGSVLLLIALVGLSIAALGYRPQRRATI